MEWSVAVMEHAGVLWNMWVSQGTGGAAAA